MGAGHATFSPAVSEPRTRRERHVSLGFLTVRPECAHPVEAIPCSTGPAVASSAALQLHADWRTSLATFRVGGRARRRLCGIVFTAISLFWATKQNCQHWAQ